jgi:5'-nucleotidase
MNKKHPTILITNDDGFDSKGIAALTEVMRPFGNIVVVAPERAYSGMSHAITINIPIRIQTLKEEPNFSSYKCSGTPVDCIKIALDQILDDKPDYLVSGINHGSNASVSAIYSGTMAAALEGSINGIPSVGFSLLNHAPNASFTASKHFVHTIMEKIMESGIPKDTCLNVNIPDKKLEEIQGIRPTRQAKGIWVEEFLKRTDPSHRDYYWLTGSFLNYENDAPDTDEWALNNNYVSVTPLHTDLTAYKTLEHMQNWKWDGKTMNDNE